MWKIQQQPQDWKISVFISIPKKGNVKECSNYHTVALISHASKVMLKILQPGLQECVNCELPDVQAGFRKGRGTRLQIANICWIIEKAREFQKISTFALLTMPKLLTLWITTNCGNSSRDGTSRPPYMPRRNLYACQEATARTGHGTEDCSKTGKEYIKTVYCHPAYLTYYQSKS